jgi:hypothetical protein
VIAKKYPSAANARAKDNFHAQRKRASYKSQEKTGFVAFANAQSAHAWRGAWSNARQWIASGWRP